MAKGLTQGPTANHVVHREATQKRVRQRSRNKRMQGRAQKPSAPVREEEMKHGWAGASWVAWIGLVMTVVINVSHFAYTSGSVGARLSTVETRIEKMDAPGVLSGRVMAIENTINRFERRLDNLDTLTAKMASLETELRAINSSLTRLEKQFTRNGGK